MIKIILTGLLLLTFSLKLLGQQYRYIRLPRAASSEFRLLPEKDSLNLQAVNNVMNKLDLELVKKNNWQSQYMGSRGVLGRYDVVITSIDSIHNFPVELQLGNEFAYFDSNERLACYGFTTILRENKKADKRFSKFLLSAYRQETDSAYLLNANNFTTLPKLDKSVYWKRNMLNMGYGMSYLAKENPFMAHKGLAIGMGYVLEALHFIPIFGGPFFGKTQNDKIAIPIMGLASLLYWKVGFFGSLQGNNYLKHNQILHDSGYKFPRELKQK